uniref:Uncharacterized protein n=1 Tax=Octopus bimaculoides TaxID=37653 RepID=A0A0L8FXC2_OCTBM
MIRGINFGGQHVILRLRNCWLHFPPKHKVVSVKLPHFSVNVCVYYIYQLKWHVFGLQNGRAYSKEQKTNF